jgi:ElaB/YqjD/DUF883 family membrane-anchored ribosome-binding protein
MSIDSLSGTAEHEFGGLEATVGDLVSDRKMQAKGMLDEALGAAEQIYGRANNTARSVLGQAAQKARNASGKLKDFADDRPMVATGLALGIGIAVGALLLGGGRAAYDRR